MLFTLRVCLYRQLSSILENHYSSPFYSFIHSPPATRLSHSFLCVLSKTVYSLVLEHVSPLDSIWNSLRVDSVAQFSLYTKYLARCSTHSINKTVWAPRPHFEKTTRGNVKRMALIPGLYFCLNTNEPICKMVKLQDVSRPDTPEPQAPVPNHKFGFPNLF